MDGRFEKVKCHRADDPDNICQLGRRASERRVASPPRREASI